MCCNSDYVQFNDIIKFLNIYARTTYKMLEGVQFIWINGNISIGSIVFY